MWKYIIYNQPQKQQKRDWRRISSFIKRQYKIIFSLKEFCILTKIYDNSCENWERNNYHLFKDRNVFKSLFEYWFIEARGICVNYWDEDLITEYRISQKWINLMKLVQEEKQKWYRKRIVIPRYEENNIWIILLIISILIWWFSLYIQIKNS